MTLEFGKSRLLLPALLATSIGLIGCGGSSSDNGGGGGDDGGDTSSDGITVLPERFNFGLITEGNSAQPREFTLSNEGEASYNISNMSLVGTDKDEFVLDENGGDTPCAARALTLDPGESCTVAVSFAPQSFNEFSATLLVRSNDPNAPSVARALSGTFAEVESINVTVNQINACPRTVPAQAFVSVTDQAGFPIKDLAAGDFTLEELGVGSVSNPAAATPVGESGTSLALSIVMDYSTSITNFDSALTNMENAARLLVEPIQAPNQADIIKYRDQVKLMTPDGFTFDKGVLEAAIAEDPQFTAPTGTAFYDATVAAIERIESQSGDRQAVLSLTDGEDTASAADLNQTIVNALGTDVPVFTIGFGDVILSELQALADDTGGLFYNPAADANLQQVSEQLSSLLFADQYVLDFDSALGEGAEASLVVAVEFVKEGTPFAGEASKTVLACQ